MKSGVKCAYAMQPCATMKEGNGVPRKGYGGDVASQSPGRPGRASSNSVQEGGVLIDGWANQTPTFFAISHCTAPRRAGPRLYSSSKFIGPAIFMHGVFTQASHSPAEAEGSEPPLLARIHVQGSGGLGGIMISGSWGGTQNRSLGGGEGVKGEKNFRPPEAAENCQFLGKKS